jgi:hypothetical protein
MCEDIDAEGDSKGNIERDKDMWPRRSHSEKALTTMKPSHLS